MKVVSVIKYSLLIVTISSVRSKAGDAELKPRHIHLAYGKNILDMVVTWSTVADTHHKSIVEFSVAGKNGQSVEGSSEKFVFMDVQQFIHRVSLKELKENTEYKYRCGDGKIWSEYFTFQTNQLDNNWSPRLAVFGDMGIDNKETLPQLTIETREGKYDAIFHIGDMVYYWDRGGKGDQFMQEIQSVAANRPYMVTVGNHEDFSNFTNFRKRFSMPGETEGLYYSFDMGPAHFVAFSGELYYSNKYYSKDSVVRQYNWLKEDLERANKNREQRPWIVVFAHQPMYSSTDNNDACTKKDNLLRVGGTVGSGKGKGSAPGLEKLFYENGVDLGFYGHEHNYERSWPTYNHKVLNGSEADAYRNAKAPVHVISGHAGCNCYGTETETFIKNTPEWSAFRSTDHGFARMQVFNKTHLYFEQVSYERKGEAIDSVWLVKDKPRYESN